MRVLRVQRGQAADHAMSKVAVSGQRAVEALHEQHVLAGDRLDAVPGNAQAALLRQRKHRAFDTRVVPLVAPVREFGEPQAFGILDHVLWPGAAHGGAGLQKLAHLFRHARPASRLVFHELFGRGEQGFQLDDLVELADRGGRQLVATEGQGARAVFGRVQQVVDLGEVGSSGVLLDDATAPGIGRCVAQGAEDAFELDRLRTPGRQGQFVGLQRHRVGALQIGRVVDERARRHPLRESQFVEPRRHDLHRLRQLEVDVGALVRTRHRGFPCGGGPVAAGA